ncbi:hypothetical protein N185_31755 [Sinorhizobium sp. GW3]|nr:hypothetical protein N185_31755 [Sinorhizobium sp. GW3]
MSRAFVAAHQLGKFETVQTRHLNVDKRERHVLSKQDLKRLIAGPRLHEKAIVSAEQCLQRYEIFLEVIDQ